MKNATLKFLCHKVVFGSKDRTVEPLHVQAVCASCLSLCNCFLLMQSEGEAVLDSVPALHLPRQGREYTNRTLREVTHADIDREAHAQPSAEMRTCFCRTHALLTYWSYLTRLSPDLLLCFECSFDKWALSRGQRGDGGGLMKRRENRQGGGEQGEGGRKEDRGGRRKGLRCVCVCCVHGSSGHTLRREIGEGQQRAHPLLRARGWSREEGVMKKKTDNTRDESETGVCIKHNQLNYRFYTHAQLSLCVFEVRLAAGNVKLLCLYHLSSPLCMHKH